MVQCNLTNLKNRGMVFNTPSDLRGARSTDVLWSVNQSMRGKFELLPAKKKGANKVVKPVVAHDTGFKAEQVACIPQETVCLHREIDVELLTLKEAKRLYEQLKEFFG